jgi:prepilin-type N-terminal cleavage/methylation domain-containing protein
MVRNITHKKAGFTLIELLVVVAIIGLLSAIISLAVNSSRTKARDTRRITDMKQIKTGLDLYFSHGSGYPETSVWDASQGATLSCDGTVVMSVPNDPLSPTYDYVYAASGSSFTGCSATVRSGYQIQFFIENQSDYYFMDEDGNVTDGDGNPASFDSLL